MANIADFLHWAICLPLPLCLFKDSETPALLGLILRGIILFIHHSLYSFNVDHVNFFKYQAHKYITEFSGLDTRFRLH